MRFNQKNIAAIREGFTGKCLFLLIECYREVKTQKQYDLNWEEEKFSAVLIDRIENCNNAKKWNIDIIPEYRLYSDDILNGTKSPKSASRIDMRFCGWISQNKLIFYIEAKNLCENNWWKENGTEVNASKLQERYIEKGIGNFLNNSYPYNSCIAGYVLEGQPNNIVRKINELIKRRGREKEILVINSPINHHNEVFQSFHLIDQAKTLLLKHIFLKF